MTSCDSGHDITFQLPHPEAARSIAITLRPWSQRLMPRHLEEFLETAGSDVREHFHHLWEYRLDDIAEQIDPLSWQLWRSDIPSDIYQSVVRHGLDKVATFHLLSEFPDLQKALSNGPFLASLVNAWIAQVKEGDYGYAMVVMHTKLSMKRHVAIGYYTEDDTFPVSPLRIKLLGYLPGTFDFRDRDVMPLYSRMYDPLLPHFFSSRRRFKEKLHALNAFYMACQYSGVPVEWAAPLFSRVIRKPHKLRLNHLKMLFIRLKGSLHVLGIPSLKGILQGMGSLRTLEKHVRRLESRLKVLRLDRIIPDTVPEFPAIPIASVPHIEPILTCRDLLTESAYMINCISSFEETIRLGMHAAFRMCWPERATVLLVRSDGEWNIEDARAFNNEQLDPSTMVILQGWLKGNTLPNPPKPLPEFFPLSLKHLGGEWRYSMEIDSWEYLAEKIDQGGNDFYDPCWLHEGHRECGNDLSCVSRLPDNIQGWSRAHTPEDLLLVGFDADMLSETTMSNLTDPGKYVYIHPGLTLGYVVIHDPAEPHHSIEVVKHHFAHWKGMSLQAQQLVESLRQQLNPY